MPSSTYCVSAFAGSCSLRSAASPEIGGENAVTAGHALSGVRRFPKESVNLDVFFVMVVRSLISHLAEKEENRCVHTPIDESANRLIDRKYTPRDAELAAADDVARVIRDFAADQVMTDYIRLRVEEQFRNAAEYARALGVSVAQIHNMNRRLARYRDRSARHRGSTDERPN